MSHRSSFPSGFIGLNTFNEPVKCKSCNTLKLKVVLYDQGVFCTHYCASVYREHEVKRRRRRLEFDKKVTNVILKREEGQVQGDFRSYDEYYCHRGLNGKERTIKKRRKRHGKSHRWTQRFIDRLDTNGTKCYTDYGKRDIDKFKKSLSDMAEVSEEELGLSAKG